MSTIDPVQVKWYGNGICHTDNRFPILQMLSTRVPIWNAHTQIWIYFSVSMITLRDKCIEWGELILNWHVIKCYAIGLLFHLKLAWLFSISSPKEIKIHSFKKSPWIFRISHKQDQLQFQLIPTTRKRISYDKLTEFHSVDFARWMIDWLYWRILRAQFGHTMNTFCLPCIWIQTCVRVWR